MSQDIEDSRTCILQVRLLLFRVFWLVVAVCVDGERAEEFAGGGVDDTDVEVLEGLLHGQVSGWVKRPDRPVWS